MSQFEETDEDAGTVEVEEIDVPVTPSKPASQRIELSPADFLFGKTLGEGAFARVVHAKSKRTGGEFAIKIMEKRHIKKENKTKHVIMERRILTMLSHPLVVKFHFAFQDPEYLFMCMELVPGGTLSDVIALKQREWEKRGQSETACDLYTTQFYIAEIVMVLEYIHGLDILHRDLKPENILMTMSGHIKLTDFGTAAICSESLSPRTSFVGTQDYVSPEVLTGERTATIACDLWAVGCMVYQLLCGQSPFHAATEFLTFEQIMSFSRGEREISYPASVPELARELIQELLKAEESERLGAGDRDSGRDYSALKQHAFFEVIDWTNLLETTPPYTPSSLPSSSSLSVLQESERYWKDGAGTDWLLDSDPTLITSYYRLSDVQQTSQHAAGAASAAADHNKGDWSQFLRDGESVLFTSIVYKTVGLFSKKRQLILTDRPRLVYVDPVSLEQKGEIPWTKTQGVVATATSSEKFEVLSEQTRRTYYLSSKETGSEVWVQQINSAVARQRSLSQHQSTGSR